MAFLLVAFSSATMADAFVPGKLDYRPQETAGVWLVGGRPVDATDQTRLLTVNGPLRAGACVRVK
jgi:hypothetical protein